ncbi:hypothetical protein [Calidifontibacter terrae]
MKWGSALIVLAFALVALVGGGLITVLCFRIVDRGDRSPTPPSPPPPASEGGPVEAAGSTLRGGAWIGALERIAVYSGLLLGWKEAIAIALAVKGLGRYPELKNGDRPAVAERFIIGTFVSVLWACACAGVAHWLIS